MKKPRYTKLFLLAVGLVIFLVATPLIVPRAGNSSRPLAIVTQGEERFPMNTPGEARSFTNAWAVVKVVNETAGDVSGPGAELGEGYAERIVELAVTDSVWLSGTSIRLDPIFSIKVLGYSVHKGELIPLVFGEAQRMEVGKSYLVGLIVESRRITMASPRGVFAVADGKVDASVEGRQRGPLLKHFAGLSAPNVGRILATATPVVSDSLDTFEERLAEYNK